MDFGIQYLNQSSSGDVFTSSTYINLQGQTVQTQAVQVTQSVHNGSHTHLNLWGRVVYVQQAENAGGNFIQPRFIMNWTF